MLPQAADVWLDHIIDSPINMHHINQYLPEWLPLTTQSDAFQIRGAKPGTKPKLARGVSVRATYVRVSCDSTIL